MEALDKPKENITPEQPALSDQTFAPDGESATRDVLDTLKLYALQGARSNVMLADLEGNILYANTSTITALRELESEIKKTIPRFSADMVMGANYDSFHKDPSHQRRILSNPKNLPHKADLIIGPVILELEARAIFDESGTYAGVIVEWEDVTRTRELEQALQSSSDNMVKIADQVQSNNQEMAARTEQEYAAV